MSVSTFIPIVCGALLSANGAPSGLEAHRMAALNRTGAVEQLERFVAAEPEDPNNLAAFLVLRDQAAMSGRYAMAAQWHNRALSVSSLTVGHLSDELVGVPAQVADLRSETLDLSVGLIGFPRVQARFGDAVVSALVDTGAEYAVVTESFARRAGLEELPRDPIRVGGAQGGGATARIAVADIELGRSSFRNAVILIVPDSALTFPLGLRIDAIVGMPQLRSFAAIDLGDGQLVTHATAPEPVAPGPNMTFDGWRLLTSGQVDDEGVSFMIDTGARRSVRYVEPDPEDRRNGVVTAHGLGGSAQFRGTTRRADVSVAGRTVRVGGLQTRQSAPGRGCANPGPRSLLGWDVLGSSKVRIDFSAMRIDWLP